MPFISNKELIGANYLQAEILSQKMNKNLLYCFICFLAFYFSYTAAQAQAVEERAKDADTDALVTEFKKALSEDLLEAWYPRTIDKENGGFYSNFSHDWQLEGNQDKMIVSQARHVWTNSKASEFDPSSEVYRNAAAHGFGFLKSKFWDRTYGGFYDLVDQEGNVIVDGNYSRYKRTYGNAFAIYALAAYYSVSKDEEALALAKESFLWLEKYAHDSLYGGYFPSLTRVGEVVSEDTGASFYENVGVLYKDQNTSIHLLEAFAELYKVWPDKRVEARLKEMLHIIRDVIATEPGYLQLFFYRDWKPVSLRDSSETIIKANFLIDHVSFGHDIETAFLMLEASHVLGNFEWEQTLQVAKTLVDHTIQNGFDQQIGGIYDQGYYFNQQKKITIVDERKNWWAQAEALNSLLLFSRLFPGEALYKKLFLKQWRYIQQYLIDEEFGGWYAYGIDSEPKAKYWQKAQVWKAAYHDGRALMNVIKMLESKDVLSQQ